MEDSLKLKVINYVLKILRMTCKDTSPMISEMMDHEISFFRRLRLKIHLAICEVCMYYKEQLEIIKNVSRNLGREETEVKRDASLSPAAREKIKKLIESHK